MSEIKEKVWECGKENAGDVIATLSGTTLTFTGKGEMRDYCPESWAPWFNKDDIDIRSVIIQNGITNIGNYAFLVCYGLNSITIPEGVRTIGIAAFAGCSSLKSINIPKSLRKIGNFAFRGCESLRTVTNPRHTPQIILDSSSSEELPRKETFPFDVKIRDCPPNWQNRVEIECWSEDEERNGNNTELILRVPPSAVGAYENAPFWKWFNRIKGIPQENLTREQLEAEISRIDEEITKLEKQKGIYIKKLCMCGEGNPKDVAAFMSLFNQRDGLKYLTHDFDKTGDFDTDTFMAQTQKIIGEHLEQLHIPQTLSDLLRQFVFETNPQWTAFDKEYNPKHITSGWSSPDWQASAISGLHPIKQPQWAEVIKDFKRLTRIESPNLETLVDKVFADETFLPIEKRDLSKADFYTHVEQFYSALQVIFEEIQKRGNTDEKKKVSVEYKRAGTCDEFFKRNVEITHYHSYPTGDYELLIKNWLGSNKGNMGKIFNLLQGYCHWSVITKIGERPIKVNILQKKGIRMGR